PLPHEEHPVAAVLLDGQPRMAQEIIVERPDGRRLTIQANISALRDRTGAIVGAINCFDDITAEKQAARALQESEQRFSVAIRSSPITVFNQDRELRFTWIQNSSFGFAPKDVLGKTDHEILDSAEAERLVQLKRRAIESGAGVRDEVVLRHQGDVRYFDLSIEPLRDEHGVVTGVTGAGVDITARRRAEQQLAQDVSRRRNVERELRDRNRSLNLIADCATRLLGSDH